MHHRLIAIASFLSLPACIVTLALCLISTLHPLRWSETIDSYASRNDRADFEVHHCVGLSNGVVYVQAVQRGQVAPGFSAKAVEGYPAEYAPAKTVLGFNLTWTNAAGWSFHEGDLPLWPIALVSSIVPMRAFLARRRGKRVGLCGRCHYDLTGNRSGVCPECGKAIEDGWKRGRS